MNQPQTIIAPEEASRPPARSRAAAPACLGEPAQNEGFVQIEGQEIYSIRSFDDLPPFLISVVSDSDLWMYVSSAGGLTAGRRCADRALFPYETDNRLHYVAGATGPITLIRTQDGETWQPFAGDIVDPARVQRNLYKNIPGNQLMFEEVNRALGLTFRYRWANCDEFGFVRTSTLVNHSSARAVSLELIDGLLNVQPAGASVAIQQGSSCLIEAFSYCEVDRESKLAMYALNSLITDRAEPAESLHANVAWCRGLPAGYRVMLSDRQLRAFRRGEAINCESRVRGQRAAFLVNAPIQLMPGQAMSWDIVADVHLTQRSVGKLREFLLTEPRPNRVVRERVDAGTASLIRIVAAADGISAVADRRVSAHHFANALFNNLRGGVFVDQGQIGGTDFARFVVARNIPTAQRHAAMLAALPQSMVRHQLMQLLESTGDANLIRIGFEYLPLSFGRRHGDPSRPWNQFEIRVKGDDGARALNYQGNWRDIFQNWEALCASFPEYLESVIAKFVNASTIDGFNPYRITSDGIDWETPDEGNEWGHLGYWGDHQITYLLRLLEASQKHYPNQLKNLLRRPLFTYADVPYRLRSYEAMLVDHRHTIDFDRDKDRLIASRVEQLGADGRLMMRDGGVVHVSLAEKLLVPILAKLCSLVPGGGIWMNTQRPEWNDANNALAGNGLSVVTLCYLRRAIVFLNDLFDSAGVDGLPVSSNVVQWLEETRTALQDCGHGDCDISRRRCMDALGGTFSRYRDRAYVDGLGVTTDLAPAALVDFMRDSLTVIDQSIACSRRADGLFHSYNLLHASPDSQFARIERLPVMLEGQVAAISSGLLSCGESAALIDALYQSELHRPDQQSFVLYPDLAATPFLKKNFISAEAIQRSSTLAAMANQGDDRIIVRDGADTFRFASNLRNEYDLRRALDTAASASVNGDRQKIVELYEQTFEHHRFTGRSGSMFGYEGLGCVYWHMTAKLLVAVQEAFFAAMDRAEAKETLGRLAAAYYRIRDGLGFNKTARQFGAFPTDPYSHTPGHGGARQPGMTGQVKEELLTRLGELGVCVQAGSVRFDPKLLCASEFIAAPTTFSYIDHSGEERELRLNPPALVFTYCQTPIVYHIDDAGPRVQIFRRDGRHEVVDQLEISPQTARELFSRSGEIIRIEVNLPQHLLRNARRNP